MPNVPGGNDNRDKRSWMGGSRGGGDIRVGRDVLVR
jgi:hypothetical protein